MDLDRKRKMKKGREIGGRGEEKELCKNEQKGRKEEGKANNKFNGSSFDIY